MGEDLLNPTDSLVPALVTWAIRMPIPDGDLGCQVGAYSAGGAHLRGRSGTPPSVPGLGRSSWRFRAQPPAHVAHLKACRVHIFWVPPAAGGLCGRL